MNPESVLREKHYCLLISNSKLLHDLPPSSSGHTATSLLFPPHTHRRCSAVSDSFPLTQNSVMQGCYNENLPKITSSIGDPLEASFRWRIFSLIH
ncbi:hypothetical protein L6452_10017 [Arctium lappa]|uniref:Uncharacterized protein n=1 Tax=Arctium lappa TaxID=4217 RepID=A0ACB9DLJ5_ARCLA|nr:hypothetical protein L6452_10017 [Arctium lappa]